MVPVRHQSAGPAAGSERAVPRGWRTLPQSDAGGTAMRKSEPFPALLRAFFYEWLAEQRNASIHTVRSYRDTWRLFLRFVAERKGRRVAQISLADLTASEVSAFLSHAEHERQGTIGTRNCRLAAIRGFFNFVAGKEPTLIAQCAEILTVPVKRAPVAAPCYLEPMEVEAILAQPDRSKLVTPHSFRHATAVHLVSAGVDITVIRSWLGHVSLDTTNHYAQANLETKRKAPERVGAPTPSGKQPPWKRDASVLAWLDTL